VNVIFVVPFIASFHIDVGWILLYIAIFIVVFRAVVTRVHLVLVEDSKKCSKFWHSFARVYTERRALTQVKFLVFTESVIDRGEQMKGRVPKVAADRIVVAQVYGKLVFPSGWGASVCGAWGVGSEWP
jgi:hypothetical protein